VNPGPVEEVGKVASGFVDALRDSPTVLAMTVFNILFLAFVLWSTMEERRWRERVVQMMVNQQTDSAKLLFQCVPYEQVQKLFITIRDSTKNWQP